MYENISVVGKVIRNESFSVFVEMQETCLLLRLSSFRGQVNNKNNPWVSL